MPVIDRVTTGSASMNRKVVDGAMGDGLAAEPVGALGTLGDSAGEACGGAAQPEPARLSRPTRATNDVQRDLVMMTSTRRDITEP